ncbi:MAG TPA: hypothetical protein VFT43_07710 [Candidatus Polarisedimenticolia bacterium]|nr:hypothetical protein [Candidatus Polarisedimenticolia bacterium]
MRGATRFTLIAAASACLLAGPALGPPLPRATRSPLRAPTIEPTLPVVLDLRPGVVLEAGKGGRSTLQAAVTTGQEVRDLTLRLVLPDGVAAEDEASRPEVLPAPTRGGGRIYLLPLIATRQGSFPIRMEAEFTLDDGRVFQTTQGTTLNVGVREEPGRRNAGAIEYRGVPLEELSR